MMFISLTGCAAERSEVPSLSIVPDIVEYSPEQQSQAAKEVSENKSPMLSRMIGDYLDTRDQIREAHKIIESPSR